MPQPSTWRFQLTLLSVALASCSLVAATPALAEDLQPNDRYIVKYREADNSAANQLALANSLRRATASLTDNRGQRPTARIARQLATNGIVIEFDQPLDNFNSQRLMNNLASQPGVEYVEVDQIVHPSTTPNDGLYANQWAFNLSNAGLNIRTAWSKSSGQGVVVAVLDTGITSHPDLDGNTLPGYDFISDAWRARDDDGRDADPTDEGNWYASSECKPGQAGRNSDWHGTHVAGTIAAVANNTIGIVGTAYDAMVVPVRVLGKCGGRISDVADAIVWASGGSVSNVPDNAHPAEVINLSLGSNGQCSMTYQSAINTAIDRGSTVVVAAGNSSTDVANNNPANCSNVIAVAATTSAGALASFSNYGSGIDVSAPGQSIYSTYNSGLTTPTSATYSYSSGTSMAAPHVAGVIALMQATAISPLTPAQAEEILKSTARAMPGACVGGCGAGLIDAGSAVDAAGNFDPGSAKR